MPELPEVETVRRGLLRRIRGRVVTAFTIHTPTSVHSSEQRLKRLILGQRILNIERRGKLLIMHFPCQYRLVFHLMMSGQLIVRREKETFTRGKPNIPTDDLPNQWTRFSLELGNQALFMSDQRRFGYVKLFSAHEFSSWLTAKNMGPEPLGRSFTPSLLSKSLSLHKRMNLKSFLLDQHNIGGLGNIYADESLFWARLHPSRLSGSLSKPNEPPALFDAIRKVLRRALAAHGTTFSVFRTASGKPGRFWQERSVYGREGRPCRRCGTRISKIWINGRGTHFCPTCQKLQ